MDIRVLLLHRINQHLHSNQRVAPTGGAGVALVSGGGAWALGAFSNDIIVAGTEADPFDIHGVDVEAPNTNASYEIVFYYGGADLEGPHCTFTRTNAGLISRPTILQSVIIPLGSRVRAKMMDSVGGSACSIKIWYHNY